MHALHHLLLVEQLVGLVDHLEPSISNTGGSEHLLVPHEECLVPLGNLTLLLVVREQLFLQLRALRLQIRYETGLVGHPNGTVANRSSSLSLLLGRCC